MQRDAEILIVAHNWLRCNLKPDRRKGKPVFKVRAKKHSFWMNAGRVPAQSMPRYGEDTQGEFFIHGLTNIADHLQFLLNNTYMLGLEGSCSCRALGFLWALMAHPCWLTNI